MPHVPLCIFVHLCAPTHPLLSLSVHGFHFFPLSSITYRRLDAKYPGANLGAQVDWVQPAIARPENTGFANNLVCTGWPPDFHMLPDSF